MTLAYDLTNILYLDIETVSGYPTYEELPEVMRPHWAKKAKSALRRYNDELTEEEVAEAYTDRAGIFAEFGKIVCISVGFLINTPDGYKMRVKSFASKSERELLTEFGELIAAHYNNTRTHGMCGHNVREFDIPYICRRMLINGVALPEALNIAGKKPWECKHIVDTLELWKFGDYKNYTSLALLAAVFGIPTPKDDIDGSEVGRVYWEEDDLDRIAIYCEKDVVATVQLMLKLHLRDLLPESAVSRIPVATEA